MKFDRRDFIRIGAAGALGTFGHIQPGSAWPGRAEAQPPSPYLRMRFRGLCLLEDLTNAMVVHLIDSKTIDLAEHRMEMAVPKNAIDLSATKAEADCEEVIGNKIFLKWHLKDRTVIGPPPPNGSGNLKIDNSVPPDPEKPKPDTDEGWKSLHWVPDLNVLCGATKILKPASATIALNHGEFRSKRADEPGPRTVWKFTEDQSVVLRRRLTDQVLYLCSAATALTIMVGPYPIVFKAGVDETIEVSNLPVCHPLRGSRKVNMDHFEKLYTLIDAKRRPKPTCHECPADLVEPDYCPPGRIKR